MNFLTKV